MITEESNVSYIFKDDRDDIKVHFLEGYIFVVADDYQQMFTRGEGRVEPKDLRRIYPTIERVRKDAQMYTEGITNTEKLLDGIHNLYKLRVIDEDKLRILRQFVSQIAPNTSPESIVRQLVLIGFDNIAGVLHFADVHPELIRSCDAFYRFVCDSRQFFSENK